MLKPFLEHMGIFGLLVVLGTFYLGWSVMCLKIVKNNIPKEAALAFINSLKPPLNWLYFYNSGTESLRYIYTSLNTVRLYIVVAILIIAVGILIFVDDANDEDIYRRTSAILWLIITLGMFVSLRIWTFGNKLVRDD